MNAEPAAQPKPYRIWTLLCPFRKDGWPVLGTMGRSIEGVVIFKADEWKRLMQDHPSLATAQFEVGAVHED